MKLNYFVNLETTLLGFKDEENNIVIPAKYNAVSEFNEGYAVFEYNIEENEDPKKIIGFINEKGEELKFDCEKAAPFKNGLAALKVEGKWKLIDTEFKTVSEEDEDYFNLKITDLNVLAKLVEKKGISVLNWADPDLFVADEDFEVIKTSLKNHLKGLVPKIDKNKIKSEKQFANLIQKEYDTLKDLRNQKINIIYKNQINLR